MTTQKFNVVYKGGNGFMQAIGLIQIFCATVFLAYCKGSTLRVLQQQLINGRGSMQTLNGDVCVFCINMLIRISAVFFSTHLQAIKTWV